MEKNFQLRWATGADARIHSDGEWQLHFKHGAARDFANKHLSRNEWLAPSARPDEAKEPPAEIYYIFWKQVARPVVLENLVRAGIRENDIE